MGFFDWAPQLLDMASSAGNTIMQGQNLAYQKEVQEKTWAREDNAVQRRVKDLEAAGLSPVLAAGSAASSSAPIQVTTPQFNPNASEKSNAARALMSDLKLQQQDSAIKREQFREIKANADVAENTAKLKEEKAYTDLLQTQLNREKDQWNFDLAKKNGIRTDVNGKTADMIQAKDYIQSKIDLLLEKGGTANDALVQELRKLLSIF